MLIGRQAALEQGPQFPGVHGPALFQHHAGDERFTEVGMRLANDGSLFDRIAFGQDSFAVGGVYVRRADNDDVFDPVVDIEVTVIVLMPDIAGSKPAIVKAVGRCALVAPVIC